MTYTKHMTQQLYTVLTSEDPRTRGVHVHAGLR